VWELHESINNTRERAGHSTIPRHAKVTFLWSSLTDIHRTENFDSLAELVASYPQITRTTHFVFVPGPLDLTSNVTLPRRPILSSFTSQLRAKVPKVHFSSNPCRLKFFAQEIVIFREDIMARMLRNTVEVKPNVTGEDLRRYVCCAAMSSAIVH
jgi:DNA polymerase epsilon subunit 2